MALLGPPSQIISHLDRSIFYYLHQGRTQSFDYHEWTDIAAQGAALQFVFVVASVADEGDLNDSPAGHHWGFGLLRAALPRALNRPNSLETGENGVELKGTPTNIGQHALELR